VIPALLRDRGVRAFLLVWIGQLVSLLGSGVTAFALGVWIFQSTASTTQYALVVFCATVPPLAILPVAGPLIDRRNRKRILIGCDLAGMAATAAVGLLAHAGALTLARACAIVAVMASASALQWPTWSATVTLLVPSEHLGRAGGLTQIALAMSQILSPALAGALISFVGLVGIAAIDGATFLFSALTLAAAALPVAAAAPGARRSYWRDLPLGWSYVFSRPGLAALLLIFSTVGFFSELASILFTPLVLSFTTPAALGSILAIGGLGMIGGGAVMSVWGGPRRPALGTAVFGALGGVAVAAAGVTVSVPLLAAAAAAFFFCQPVLSGSGQVVWQRTIPAELQGRVFAARATLTMAGGPLAALVAGPLADRLFEPAMAAGSPLSRMIGTLVGVGPGRGIAVILVVAGTLCVLAATAAGFYGPLRRLDEAADLRHAVAAAAAQS